MEGFGKRLKEARGSISQAAFAKKLGVSQVCYSRYELDQREPDLETLCQIGIETGRSADWLLGLPTHSQPESGGIHVTATGSATVAGNNMTVNPSDRTQPGALPPSSPPIPVSGDCANCQLLRDHIRAVTGRG